MSLKEDIEELKTKAEELEQESFAREMLRGCKRINTRLFWIWFITFIALIGVSCYLIYVLNDTGVSEEIIDIDGVETIDNSHIKIGDDIWEKSE